MIRLFRSLLGMITVVAFGAAALGQSIPGTFSGGGNKPSAPPKTYTNAELQTECDAGAAAACSDLGERLAFGEGARKDDKAAAALYQRGCDGGDGVGCVRLALAYSDGIGVKADQAKAVRLSDRACKANNALGCAVMGQVYVEGFKEYPKDAARGRKLLFDSCFGKADFKRDPDGASKIACPALAKLDGKPACQRLVDPGQNVTNTCYGGDGKWQVTREAAPVVAPPTVIAPVANRSNAANAAVVAGDAAYDRKDYVTAVARFAEGCDGGSLRGCTLLGIEYKYGRPGFVKNAQRASQLFAQACDGGSTVACGLLGEAYDFGDGVSQNVNRAVQLYTTACDSGEHISCHGLAMIYYTGLASIGQNYQKSVQLFRSSCNKGYKNACVGLANAYSNGHGISVNKAESARLLSPYCKTVTVCIDLSFDFNSSSAKRRVPEFAATVLGYACDRNYAIGCSFLSLHYRDGSGVPRDPVREADLSMKACNLGRASGCHDAAVHYRDGHGVPVNSAIARQLYKRGCDGGAAPSCVNLATYYSNGDGVAKDYDVALNLLNRAITLDPKNSAAHNNIDVIKRRRLQGK